MPRCFGAQKPEALVAIRREMRSEVERREGRLAMPAVLVSGRI
jgi:hypothetical protein